MGMFFCDSRADRILFPLSFFFAAGFSCPTAQADVLVPYTSNAAFNEAAAGKSVFVEDYGNIDNETEFPTGTTLNGITYTYNPFHQISPGISAILNVTNSFPSITNNKSLGTTDANILENGDDITFSFASKAGFGLFIISSEADISDNDFTLTGGGGSVSLLASAVQKEWIENDVVVARAWFLGLQYSEMSTFSSATLTSRTTDGSFLFNLANPTLVSVPEPSTFFLFSLGLLVFMAVNSQYVSKRIRQLSTPFPRTPL